MTNKTCSKTSWLLVCCDLGWEVWSLHGSWQVCQAVTTFLVALKLAMNVAPFLAKNFHLSFGDEFCTFPRQKCAPLSLPSWRVLSSLFPLPKTLRSSKQFAFFILLLSNGMKGIEAPKQTIEFPAAPSFSSKKWIKLIPKTIGNRKRDCAWGCARRINTTSENLQIEKHKSVRWAERTPSWFVLFNLQIFWGGVYPPSATSRTISFSISNSYWYYSSYNELYLSRAKRCFYRNCVVGDSA